MSEKITHPVSNEDYKFRLPRQLNGDESRILFDFFADCRIHFIYKNGWFYFKTIDDYTTTMLII